MLRLTLFPSPTEGFPWDDLRKIFREYQRMANVAKGIETLPKILRLSRVHKRYERDTRETDGRRHNTANVKMSSRSLKMTNLGGYLSYIQLDHWKARSGLPISVN